MHKTETCWEWVGTIRPDGYGILQKGPGLNSFYRAHRLSWEIHYGKIPYGKHICHHCDNPKCVNPEHLFVGTDADNQRDKWEKGRGNPPPKFPGSKNHNAKLTEKDVKNMRTLRKKGWSNREIAELYPQMNPGSIKGITSGASWKHVR